MGIRKINPTSPGQRGMSKNDFADVTTDKPEKSLLKPIKKKSGRNNTGRITCQHKGGGHKRASGFNCFKFCKKDGAMATPRAPMLLFLIKSRLFMVIRLIRVFGF